jgi:hypothetical protein
MYAINRGAILAVPLLNSAKEGTAFEQSFGALSIACCKYLSCRGYGELEERQLSSDPSNLRSNARALTFNPLGPSSLQPQHAISVGHVRLVSASFRRGIEERMINSKLRAIFPHDCRTISKSVLDGDRHRHEDAQAKFKSFHLQKRGLYTAKEAFCRLGAFSVVQTILERYEKRVIGHPTQGVPIRPAKAPLRDVPGICILHKTRMVLAVQASFQGGRPAENQADPSLPTKSLEDRGDSSPRNPSEDIRCPLASFRLRNPNSRLCRLLPTTYEEQSDIRAS